jgi:hypothetical protein
MEAEVKDILSNIRKSKPLLQDFCLLGIATGAPAEFVEHSAALAAHYSEQLLGGARAASASASSGEGGSRVLEQSAQKLCDLWGKLTVGLMRQVIDKAEKQGGIDDSSINQVCQSVSQCCPIHYIIQNLGQTDCPSFTCTIFVVLVIVKCVLYLFPDPPGVSQ